MNDPRSFFVLLALLISSTSFAEFFNMRDMEDRGCPNGRCNNRSGFSPDGTRTFTTNGFRAPRVINENISSSSSDRPAPRVVSPNLQQLASQGFTQDPNFPQIFSRSSGGKNYMYYLGTDGRPYPVTIKADGRAYFNGTNDSINDYVQSYYRRLRKEQPAQWEEISPRFNMAGGKDFVSKLDSVASNNATNPGFSGNSADSANDDVAPPPNPGGAGQHDENSNGHSENSTSKPESKSPPKRAEGEGRENPEFQKAKERFDFAKNKGGAASLFHSEDEYIDATDLQCRSQTGKNDYSLKLSLYEKDAFVQSGGQSTPQHRVYAQILEDTKIDPSDAGKTINPTQYWYGPSVDINGNTFDLDAGTRKFQFRYADGDKKSKPIVFISGTAPGGQTDQWICETNDSPERKQNPRGNDGLPNNKTMEKAVSPTLDEWRTAMTDLSKNGNDVVAKLVCKNGFASRERMDFSSAGEFLGLEGRRCRPVLSTLSNGIQFFDQDDKRCGNIVVRKIPKGEQSELTISYADNDCVFEKSITLPYDKEAPKGITGAVNMTSLRIGMGKGVPFKELSNRLLRGSTSPTDLQTLRNLTQGEYVKSVLDDQLALEVIKEGLDKKQPFASAKSSVEPRFGDKIVELGYDRPKLNAAKVESDLLELSKVDATAAGLDAATRDSFLKTNSFLRKALGGEIKPKASEIDDQIASLPKSENLSAAALRRSMESVLKLLSNSAE